MNKKIKENTTPDMGICVALLCVFVGIGCVTMAFWAWHGIAAGVCVFGVCSFGFGIFVFMVTFLWDLAELIAGARKK